jgi:sugar lactone lactonase YvrE
MTAYLPTLIPGFTFLEAPRWHDGRLWFSDLYSFRVLSALEDGTDLREEAIVPGQPLGLGWLPDGRLLVVSQHDQRILRREPDGTLVTHADLSSHAAFHLNDLVVDAHGRAYVGDFGFNLYIGEPMRPGALLRVDPDGAITKAADDLWFPNGAVITEQNVLVVNETFGNRVTAFDLTDAGKLVNRRVWAAFGPLPTARFLDDADAELVVVGDGNCLDAEGGLWVADIKGHRLLRVLEGGEVSDEIRPDMCPFACALGGSDGRTLFVCVAPDYDVESRKSAREAEMRAVQVKVPAAGT